MDKKTFLFGLGVGTVIVSAFLLIIFMLDSGAHGSGKPVSQMTDREVVAGADAMIKEAGSRGVQNDIDVSSIAGSTNSRPGNSEMTDGEIELAAEKLGMIYPPEISDSTPDEPTATPSPTPAPTDNPSPTPSPTDTPSPAPSPTDTPTPQPTATPVPTAAPSAEDQGDSIHVTIPEGASSDVVCRLLYNVGLVQDADYYNQYIMKNGKEDAIRYGEYDIPKDSTAAEILAIIAS